MTDEDKRFTAACAAMQGLLSNSQIATVADSPSSQRILVWNTANLKMLASHSLDAADALLAALAPAAEPGGPDDDSANEIDMLNADRARLTAERDELKERLEKLSRLGDDLPDSPLH